MCCSAQELMAAPMEDQDRAQALQARQDLEEVWGGRTWEKDKGKERERETEVSDPDGEHQTKWRRPSHKGKGPSQSSWAGWGNGRNQRQWREEKEGEAGSTSPRSQELLKCLVKMTVRHEQELMRIRPDVGFIGFCDTSENGCLAMLRSVSTLLFVDRACNMNSLLISTIDSHMFEHSGMNASSHATHCIE